MYGLNLPPTSTVIVYDCPAGLSEFHQLTGRANRGHIRSSSKNGRIIIVISQKKYRRVIARARERLSWKYDATPEVQAKARELVEEINFMYSKFLEVNTCLPKMLSEYFQGTPVQTTKCTSTTRAPCGNCKRLWRIKTKREEARVELRTDAEAGAKSMKTSFGRLAASATLGRERGSSTFIPFREVTLKQDQSTASWKILPADDAIGKFIQSTSKNILNNHYDGLPKTRLASEIAALSGKGGLKVPEVEFCLWYYMTKGYLEEVEAVHVGKMCAGADGLDENENDNEEGEKVEEEKETVPVVVAVEHNEAEIEKVYNSKRYRLRITRRGYETKTWVHPQLNARLGNVDIESDFDTCSS
jgi:superfamily II DNA/RNA helicase